MVLLLFTDQQNTWAKDEVVAIILARRGLYPSQSE